MKKKEGLVPSFFFAHSNNFSLYLQIREETVCGMDYLALLESSMTSEYGPSDPSDPDSRLAYLSENVFQFAIDTPAEDVFFGRKVV